MPNGESCDEAVGRLSDFLHQCDAGGEPNRMLAITHGTLVYAWLVSRTSPLTANVPPVRVLKNCGVVRLMDTGAIRKQEPDAAQQVGHLLPNDFSEA
jgi:broad specificity phosphatase PhoE